MCSGVVNLALEAVTLIESPIYLGMDGEPLSATAALIPQLREKYNIIGPRALSETGGLLASAHSPSME
jgi:CTP:molybdopterin cytidylyltransferase MocA